MLRDDRKQLVGVMTDDPTRVLVEGTQLIADATIPPPVVHMLGWVTSSYRSEALGRSIALAVGEAGRNHIGEEIHAVVGETTVPCRVADPVFYDPEGTRRDG